MKQVRLGIIGVGGIGNHHLSYLQNIENLKLTALCDIDAAALKTAVGKYPVAAFPDAQSLFRAGVCDAVLIATPHYDHPPLACEAFEAGLHVLTEKPLAVHTRGAKQAIDAHRKHPELVFAIMFQLRTMPVYQKVKQLIQSGELGRLQRVNWIITCWFRSQAYYNSGGWRATWKGEGGGVLLNQCPHTLDLITWLAGMPTRVTAQASLGKYHQIEVEDEVSALLEYENGAIGQFIATTGEAPGTDRLEIAGDRGSLIVEGRNIRLHRSKESVRHFSDTTPERFKMQEFLTEDLTLERSLVTEHQTVTRNFVRAILYGEPPIIPAEEGLNGLALGNAMLLSALKKRPVAIPFDDDEYGALLEDLIQNSRFKKETAAGTKDDIGDSFH